VEGRSADQALSARHKSFSQQSIPLAPGRHKGVIAWRTQTTPNGSYRLRVDGAPPQSRTAHQRIMRKETYQDMTINQLLTLKNIGV